MAQPRARNRIQGAYHGHSDEPASTVKNSPTTPVPTTPVPPTDAPPTKLAPTQSRPLRRLLALSAPLALLYALSFIPPYLDTRPLTPTSPPIASPSVLYLAAPTPLLWLALVVPGNRIALAALFVPMILWCHLQTLQRGAGSPGLSEEEAEDGRITDLTLECRMLGVGEWRVCVGIEVVYVIGASVRKRPGGATLGSSGALSAPWRRTRAGRCTLETSFSS